MTDDPILFHARAAAETAAAEAATLDNVRDRALRSAKAWTEMAVRAERTVTNRTEREAATAAKAASARLGDGSVTGERAVLQPPM